MIRLKAVHKVNRPAYLDELYGLSRRGEFDEIINRCKKIAAELAARPMDAYPETALICTCLAHAYDGNGDFCAAAIEFENVLRLHRLHQDECSDEVVRCLMYSGRMLLWTGRPAEAEEKFAEALTLLDHLPEEQQHGRGFVLLDLAQLHRCQGEHESAERLLIQAMKPMLRFCGYHSRHYAFLFFHLAEVYDLQQRTAAADKTMAKAIRGLRLAINEDDADLALVLSHNGLRLQKRGRLKDALAFQVEALAMLERIRKPGHRSVERVKHRLETLAKAAGSS